MSGEWCQGVRQALLTREMSARTSGALMLTKRGEDARSASRKCASATEEPWLPALLPPACACTCSQARCTACAAGWVSPAHLMRAVSAGGLSLAGVTADGPISTTQLACTSAAGTLTSCRLQAPAWA